MEKKVKKYANVVYHQRFLKCGGVERYITELCYKYSKLGYELDLFYKECLNNDYLKEIAEYVGEDHIHQYKGEIIYCDTLIINYDMEGFLENVIADNVVNIIHANFYLQQNFPLHDSEKITKRLAVSKENSIAYKKRFGIDTDVCYNPITIKPKDTKRVLNLISCTRLTEEKGKPRMIELMNELEKNNIPYIWHIYTNQNDDIQNPNVMYHKPTLEVRPFIKNADYLVQLSSSEGYCYSVLESLSLSTPVIVTDLPIFKEMGVVNGKNGYVLPLDMSKIPIKEIYEKDLKGFKYEPKQDEYYKYLTKKKTTYVKQKLTKVRIIEPFYDVANGINYVPFELYALQQINTINGKPNKPLRSIAYIENKRAKLLEKVGYVEVVND